MSEGESVSRRQEILETLARELESHPQTRITTARLAQAVGVSEAALYRHFPSKARMFEDLISFAEDTVFGLVGRILSEERDPLRRCENMLAVVLGFSVRNPGITRVLLGDALVGENQRLQMRVAQFFSRLETQLKQILREGEAAGGLRPLAPAPMMAGLLMSVVEGKMSQFVRSRFQRNPLDGWNEQWPVLVAALVEVK